MSPKNSWKNKGMKDEDKFSPFQSKCKSNKKAFASNIRDNVSYSLALHNNIPHNTTKSTIPIPTPTNPYIDKVSTRRYMIAHMSIKDFCMGLLTQIPILGGVILYHKLVEIENRIEDIRKGEDNKNEQPKRQDNTRKNR
jgi:hypothetical protein